MYEYNVKEIVSIYDGDTMKVVVDLGFKISAQQTLRFYGINTLELRGDERETGIISRDWLRARIYNAIENEIPIKIKTIKDKSGKYGRLLASVYIGDEADSLNEQMVSEGLAVEYMK